MANLGFFGMPVPENLGGSGYIPGFKVKRLYRDARVTRIYEGAKQIQRNLIAHELGKGAFSFDARMAHVKPV
jgi:alkylation response protein AidB-like acyl-CoA dehydrogenase